MYNMPCTSFVYFPRDFSKDKAAGKTTITKIEGNIKNTIGKIILIGACIAAVLTAWR